MRKLLSELEITESNRGACYGADGWLADDSGADLVSINPTDGQPIAGVQTAGSQSYGRVIEQAASAFAAWRDRPAPRRGPLGRDPRHALRGRAEPPGGVIAPGRGQIPLGGIREGG
ncbi:MAG TPA: aldehyde dehydrogenase family protein, partial [Anaerolineales bacterium]|nr:aldehyde dehydrogenase family protein [Anaerolineales bacterium]